MTEPKIEHRILQDDETLRSNVGHARQMVSSEGQFMLDLLRSWMASGGVTPTSPMTTANGGTKQFYVAAEPAYMVDRAAAIARATFERLLADGNAIMLPPVSEIVKTGGERAGFVP